MPRKTLVRHFDTLDRRLKQLSREDLEGFARYVFDALYLDPPHEHDGPWEYNPDKEWGSETFNSISSAVSERLNIHPRPLLER